MGSEIETMSPEEIRQLAWEDGFDLSYTEAVIVRTAAREGRLLWTRQRITVTGRDALDVRHGEERDR